MAMIMTVTGLESPETGGSVEELCARRADFKLTRQAIHDTGLSYALNRLIRQAHETIQEWVRDQSL